MTGLSCPIGLAKEVVIWADLVVLELRIDTPRGEWDQLDKLEDAISTFKAKIGTTLTGPPRHVYLARPSHGLAACGECGKPFSDPIHIKLSEGPEHGD